MKKKSILEQIMPLNIKIGLLVLEHFQDKDMEDGKIAEELIKTFLKALASAICNISSTDEAREELLEMCCEGLGVYTNEIAERKED